jgi:hypothetical protein
VTTEAALKGGIKNNDPPEGGSQGLNRNKFLVELNGIEPMTS